MPSNKADTVIGENTILKGTLSSKEVIHIEGETEGNIINQSDVTIGEKGKVKADLKAQNVTVAGYYEGTLEAGGKLEIKMTGQACGTFKAKTLVTEEGAVFTGNTEMKGKQQVKEVS